MGRLTRDPEIKSTHSGKEICKFSIAVQDSFKKDNVFFFNCIAWGGTGSTIAQYFHKGSRILIEGALNQQRWQDKEGQNRSTVEISVASFTFVDQKSDNGNQNKPPSTPRNGNKEPDIQFDEFIQKETQELAKDVFDCVNEDDVPF